MKKIIISVTIVAWFIGGCVSSETAEHVLRGAGYTEIDLGGYAIFACSEDDTLKRTFKAKGPSGQRVSGAVCCGVVVKNCTIRTK